MAGAVTILADDSRLSRIDQIFHRAESSLALLSGLAILSLIFLAVFSVGGRNFFNAPLPGYVDWIEQIMPLIAFLGISYTQRNGGHIRMDMLVGQLKGRWLWSVELLTTLLILLLMALLVWGSWSHFSRSFDFNAPLWSRDSSMDIGLPTWPAKLLAPVAFGVLCARLTLQSIAYSLAILQNKEAPVAVPLIEDVATQAAREAAMVNDGPAAKEAP